MLMYPEHALVDLKGKEGIYAKEVNTINPIDDLRPERKSRYSQVISDNKNPSGPTGTIAV